MATDLVVDSSVLFSELDGGASDDDGVVDGLLTLSSLTLTDQGEIVLDVPVARFNVLGDVRLEGRSAIHPPEDLPPAVGPTLTILAERSILMLGFSTIAADGTEAGGTILLCASEDIDLRGRAATIASSGLGPNGVGGSIVLQGGARIKLINRTNRIMANGAVGGNVTLISCGEDVVANEENEDAEVDAGLAILINGQVQAIGSDGSGGIVEIFSRQGGIEFRGKPMRQPIVEIFTPRQDSIRDKLRVPAVDASGSTNDGTILLTAATNVTPDPPHTNPSAAITTDSPSEEACNCSLFGSLQVTIQSPENGLVTADSLVDVTGKASGAVLVTVNGVEASLFAGTFAALDVPLVEGTNVLFATALDGHNAVSDSVSVRRDTRPPLVVIETPQDGDRVVSETVAVAGTVNDIIPGATINEDDVTVTVDGIPTPVTNRSFFLPELALSLGENIITVQAVDRVGNVDTAAITVQREPDLAGVHILVTGGNAQQAPIESTLPVPLSVRLQDADAIPFPNRPVTFEVSRGDGRLDDPFDILRLITLLTDGAGNAAVDFTLGSRTGEGFHRVRVTTPGSLTFAEFCATAENTGPIMINSVQTPPASGVAGRPLRDPLSVIVTDEGGNPVPGVSVDFQVVQGGGSLGGTEAVQHLTNADGIAEASLTLGPEFNVLNLVTATFPNNPGLPVTFIVNGISTTRAPDDTTVSGIVQDSLGNPLVGVLVVIRGTELEALTEQDGRFTIYYARDVHDDQEGEQPFPGGLGGQRVGVLGSSIDDPGADVFFPDIDYAIEVVPGTDTALDQVVFLPTLDMPNAKLVGGDEDVVLTMAGVPSFGIKVFANSVILPDGTRGEVLMSSSQVKSNKVPMPPPQGATPMIIGTLQPPGIRFDPPAQVTYPNVEGLLPGDVANVFAFHHDIGQFVNVGPGTVSEDGSVVVSDPGFGILESGWHCLIRMPGPVSGCANMCTASWTWTVTKNGSETGTDKPVLICVDTDPNKSQEAEVTVSFTPSSGSNDATPVWTVQDTSIAQIVGTANNSNTVTIKAVGKGTTNLLSPKYRIPLSPAMGGDKTCQAQIEVRVFGCLEITDTFDQILPDVCETFFRTPNPSNWSGSPSVNRIGYKAKVIPATGVTVTNYKWTVDGPLGSTPPSLNGSTVDEIQFESWTGSGVATKKVKVEVTFDDGTMRSDEIEVKVLSFLKEILPGTARSTELLDEHVQWHRCYDQGSCLGPLFFDQVPYKRGYLFVRFHRRFAVRDFESYRSAAGLPPVTITAHIPLKWAYPLRTGGGPDSSAPTTISAVPASIVDPTLANYPTSHDLGRKIITSGWHGQLHVDFCSHGDSRTFTSPRDIALYWFHKRIDNIWALWISKYPNAPHFFLEVPTRTPGPGGAITVADLKNPGIRVAFTDPVMGVTTGSLTIKVGAGTPVAATSLVPVSGTGGKEYDFRFDPAPGTGASDVKLLEAGIFHEDPDDPLTPKRKNPLKNDEVWSITINP